MANETNQNLSTQTVPAQQQVAPVTQQQVTAQAAEIKKHIRAESMSDGQTRIHVGPLAHIFAVLKNYVLELEQKLGVVTSQLDDKIVNAETSVAAGINTAANTAEQAALNASSVISQNAQQSSQTAQADQNLATAAAKNTPDAVRTDAANNALSAAAANSGGQADVNAGNDGDDDSHSSSGGSSLFKKGRK